MRPRHTMLALVLVLATASAGAGTPDMSLDQQGRLLQLESAEDGLQLRRTTFDGDDAVIPVPGTAGAVTGQRLLEIDAATGAVIVAWEENIDEQLTQIRLASYADETWFGPFIVAGTDGIKVGNPTLLVQSVLTTLEDGTDVETTFAHLAWWRYAPEIPGGVAMLGVIVLDESGRPMLGDSDVYELRTLTPWGVGCDAADHAEELSHPKLFVDPGTGDTHILYVDLTDCLFEIVRLHPVLDADDDDEATQHRRRHVIEFGVRKDIVISPDLQLEGTSFEVGYDLAVVGHWDVDDGIEYIRMDHTGWSDVHTIGLESISHEDGIRLIRKLVR